MNTRSPIKNDSFGDSTPEKDIHRDEIQHPPLLRTKLHIPPIRSTWISRSRLVKRMDEGCERKLTLISAPAGFGKTTAPGATYDLHSSSYDEETRTAVFFATFHAKHTGEGGPVPPTHKETHTDYVYILTMNADDKVERMVKVWNAPWAMKELGWM